MQQSDLLDGLEADLRRLLEHTRSDWSALTTEALNTRPSPEKWTKTETLAHLNAFWNAYLPAIELAIHKGKARRWTPSGPVQYTARGKRALMRADSTNGKKCKTAKRYNYFQKTTPPSPLKSFIIGAEKLQRLLQLAKVVDLNKTTVPKAHSWFGHYTLGNLLEWLVRHAEKHLRS
ncbi:MAG: DinB family protein [Saprospiraceae bacterium]